MSEDDDFDIADPESGRREAERDGRTGRSAAAARIAQQSTWVDLQVRQAMERGEFDNLPGQGKPIEDLGVEHDPDWWVKKLVERENIALLPPALALRKEDAELDARLDRINIEGEPHVQVELGLSSDVGDPTHAGCLATAMHVVNAIPHVVRATPGVKTLLDLPVYSATAG